MDIKQKLGGRIRQLRKLKGYTQERLAEKACLSVAFIGSAERGKECPSIKTAEKIANALDVRLSELFSFADEDSGEDISEQTIERLASKLKKAKVDNIYFVSNIAERLLEKLEMGNGNLGVREE